MKNVVTPETARKLKDNRFKQPEHEAGQVWYNRGGLPYFVGKRPNGMLCFISSYGGSYEWLHDSNGFVFAPTATDILWWLGQDWTLDADWAKNNWSCWVISSVSKSKFYHENPAEAAALAWLEKYAK